MADECWGVIVAINLVKGNHLDSSTNNELNNAVEQLAFVVVSLVALEAAQLRDIFIETRAVIFEICSHMNNQAGSTSGFIIMISDLLKIIRLENIAERIKAAKPSRSSSPITLEMVGSVVALLDGVIFILSLLNVKRYDVLPVCLLKDKLIYLEVFFTLTAKQCIEHERMKDLFAHAEDVAYTAIRLCFCAAACKMEENDHQTRVRISDEYHNLLKRLSPFSPELRPIYQSLLIGSKSSGTEPIMDAKSMSNLVDAINKDLMKLLGHNASWKVTFDDRIPWLKQGLPYLSTFLHELEEFNSLQSHMEDMAIEAAIVIYTSYDERINVRSTEIDRKHFLWQMKLNSVKVEIGLIQLLNNEATIIAPLKDLIDDVREQLIFLGTLQMDSTEQCKEQTKIADLLTLIQSVNNQACFIIDFVSRHMKKEDTEHETMARELNRFLYKLLLKFKFIKAVIRQMCPNISTSSTLDHPTINLLNFLPINFDVIDSYFSTLKSSKTQSSVSPKMDEVLMGFHEYILGNILLKDESYLTFTVANEVKKYYYGLLLLVTYLVDPPVQNDLLTRFGTFAIDAESALCLIYEEAVDSNKSRKVNLVLQFLMISFELIKSEGYLMVLLQQESTLKAEIMDLIECVHTTTNPVYSHIVRSGEGKMYAVHTSTSKEVERLFPIDPRLETWNTKQIHSKAWNKMA